VERKSKVPTEEWLAVAFPAACAAILLVAALTNAAGRRHGWIVVLTCFVAGAAFPLTYTLVLLREQRLFLRDKPGIEKSRDRIAAGRPIGWLLGACLVAAGVALGGLSKVIVLAVLAGLAFGFWPGLLANFLRLRREHHWG
jgi:hypothetical protein